MKTTNKANNIHCDDTGSNVKIYTQAVLTLIF